MELKLAYDVLDILGTMQEAVGQMQVEYAAGNIQNFESLSMELQDGLTAVQEVAKQTISKGSRNRLEDACTCALESLKDIKQLMLVGSEKAEWKLEYELSAVIEVTARQFFYWGIVDEHPEEREKFLSYIADAESFCILKKAEEEREYSCDLLIAVVGYNKLEYTRECVHSILENLPGGVSYELVLYNHGSSDGTKEYFEGIQKAKTINIAVNGAVPGVLYRVAARGKYYLQISNDVMVGTCAIENLFRCISGHPDYGYVVPSTPAVSNFQTIPADYKNREGFAEFVWRNNIYDERRHEQRVRLMNPIQIVPSALYLQMDLELYEERNCNKQRMAYPDDKISLWMRRHGYKNILAKDAYCHHIGSVTINSETTETERERMYLEGRKDFFAHYGVDPWGPGICYEPELFDAWKISFVDGACILGINCGLGSNSLKVKEILREQGARDVRLINCVQDERYLADLQGISDEAYAYASLTDIIARAKRKWYDYIIVDEDVEGCRQENLPQEILNAGIEFRQLAYKAEGEWRIYNYTN